MLDAGRRALSGTRDTVFEYNVLGELVETTAGAQGPSAKRSETRYAYDGGGLLKTVTVENGTADYATTFGYDDAGNRTRVANPNFAATSFAYTALGQLRTRTDGRGTTTWTYDVLGRIKSRTDPGGGAAAWEWDRAGALGLAKKRTYNDSTSAAVEFEETYLYDADERPKTTTTTLRKSASTSDALTMTRTHAYDRYGRPLTTTTQPSALAVGYEYNARGYLSKLKQGTSALATVTAMDAWGNATGESYGNGVSTTRTFDELGRATGIATAKGTAKLQQEAYGWRSDGLLESRAVGSGANTDTEVFGYDHLGRLDSAKTYVDEATVRTSSTVDRSLSYGYDRLGNLTSKPGVEDDDHADGAGRVPVRAGRRALLPQDHVDRDGHRRRGHAHDAHALGGDVPGRRLREGGRRRARGLRLGRQDARRGGAAGAHCGDRDGDADERAGVPARRPSRFAGGGGFTNVTQAFTSWNMS
ncbi:MAG: hypothetical protein F4029_10130, partial [Gammaproteobacteria bacterium]|nr:hypothetical protein [Gammaproteobacteria bacterium]